MKKEMNDVVDLHEAGGDMKQLTDSSRDIPVKDYFPDLLTPKAKTVAAIGAVEPPHRRKGFVSASDLSDMEIVETPAIVEGLLAEGLSILAGRPKIGKSWLAFDLAIKLANGEALFGHYATTGANAVYFALEDNYRRLQNRMNQLLGGLPVPERLDFNIELPRLDEGGLDILREYLTAHPDTKLLIIDTLAKVKPRGKRGGDAYQEDYAAGNDLQKMAFEFGVAILLLHHTRKVTAEYVLDEVSGTTGVTGSADNIFVLKRDASGDYVLHTTGRDFESLEIPLRWNAKNVLFEIAGSSESAEAIGAVGRAAQWLTTYLSHEPRYSQDVFTAGDSLGHSSAAIRRAYKRLAVQCSRRNGRSYWHLPIEAGASEIEQRAMNGKTSRV